MPQSISSPEVADQFLEVVGPGLATDGTLAGGTNLNKMELRAEQGMRQRSYLDLLGLADSTDVMTNGAAVDGTIFLELVETNLRNETLTESV